MFPNTSYMKKAFCVALTVIVFVGCQQKQNKKQSLRTGRGLRGSTQTNVGANTIANSAASCGSYSVQGKMWGEVTSYQGEQAFYQEVLSLTAPVLSTLPAEDQLGHVSGQSGQYTGVRFWGNVGLLNGAVNPATSEIRIEIFDDKACQMKSDGTVRPVIPIHIGAGQPGFVSAEGYMNGTMSRITFVDNYGAIILEGQISNYVFSGTMSYTTAVSGGPRILGRFQIPVQGFFGY